MSTVTLSPHTLAISPVIIDNRPAIDVEIAECHATLSIQDVDNFITILQEWREVQCLTQDTSNPI